ncbi:MAG: hypothetical protein Ta2B_21580 [Termitinemataceae bacterium]|nr:MAG: hypothetical protein Ta2B_21580 [Termitinemataceae bacterium]
MGGGGNLANLKSLLSVVAVLVASLLVTACPVPDDGVSTEVTPRGPNTDAATQLKKLEVLYKGTTAPNLITFNTSVAEDEEQMGEYALNNPTDATKAFVTVNAEAKSAGAEIQIWWTNGNDGGGMEAAVPASGVITLSDIPVPSTEDNTYIYVNLTNGLDDNGDPKMFEYLITVPPPIIDTTLSGITLTAGASLTPSFNAKVTNYSVTGLEEKKPILITATANDAVNAKVKIDEGDGTSNSASTAVAVPDSGEAPLVVKITVTNGDDELEGIAGMTSTYTISIVPPQKALDEDSTLQTIQFNFSDDDSNTDDIPVMAGGVFKYDQTNYTFDAIPNGVTKVKLGWATARSSTSKKITVTQGTATQSSYKEINASVLDGGTCTYITLPAKGSGQILTFKVVVTAQNDSTTPYQFSFANPAKSVVWKGTMDANNITGLTFDHAEVEYLGLDGTAHSSASGTVTDTANSWSITLDDRITPTAFVAVASKGGATYRQSFPVNPTQKTGNILQMTSSMARMIYNAQEFKEIGNGANQDVNWFLANDIDLAEVSGAWNGPSGYTGTFDGNGHTVKNLVLTKTAGDTGLFNSVGTGVVIKNLVVEVSSPSTALARTGGSHFGGVVGFIGGTATIKNVTVTGTLRYGAANDYLLAGGLVGEIGDYASVDIENCVSTLDIIADLGSTYTGDRVQGFGGLIANNGNGNVTIKNSYATGNINITVASDLFVWAGGFVGLMVAPVTVQNCYASGSVRVVNSMTDSNTRTTYAGGLIGNYGYGTPVKNNVALNASVKAQAAANSSAGRVTATSGSALQDNYALSTTTVNDAVIASNDPLAVKTGIHGASKTASDMSQKAFWTTLGFSETVWDFTGLNVASGIYPKLK